MREASDIVAPRISRDPLPSDGLRTRVPFADELNAHPRGDGGAINAWGQPHERERRIDPATPPAEVRHVVGLYERAAHAAADQNDFISALHANRVGAGRDGRKGQR